MVPFMQHSSVSIECALVPYVQYYMHEVYRRHISAQRTLTQIMLWLSDFIISHRLRARDVHGAHTHVNNTIELPAQGSRGQKNSV